MVFATSPDPATTTLDELRRTYWVGRVRHCAIVDRTGTPTRLVSVAQPSGHRPVESVIGYQ